MKNDRLISAAIAIIIGFAVLSYFVRPRQPQLQLVTPQQELPGYEPRYPGDMSLSDRVLKSYELAFILVRTPYVTPNLNALEAMRQWAREQFQAHPDFLHPVSLPAADEHRDTVFGALGYNLLAIPKYWLQAQAGELLRFQIDRFHQTSAFRAFNTSYFSVFGKDADAATLLARYESDRAKAAVDIVLWAFAWSLASLVAAWTIWHNRRRDVFSSLRIVTAGTWLMLAVAYLTQAWATGHAASLVSTLVALTIAAYLYKPFLLVSHHEAKQQLVHIRLAPCWIAMAAWFTFTCLVIQLLTWMRAGIPAWPDPVSLLLASLSGNFLHDPLQGKRLVSTGIAVSWLLVTGWALLQRYKDQPYAPEPDANFDTLDRVRTLDRVS